MSFKKIVKIFIGKVYLFSKSQGEGLLVDAAAKKLSLKARIGKNVIISKGSNFENAFNDPDKIIIGDNCVISGHLLVYNQSGQIILGKNTLIGFDTKIWSSEKIVIGERVLISHNVNIHDSNSHPLDSMKRHQDFINIVTKGSFEFVEDLRGKEIIIEDDVWIGFNATILKGVRIGKGAIVGANAIITKDVPPYAVIVSDTNVRVIKTTT